MEAKSDHIVLHHRLMAREYTYSHIVNVLFEGLIFEMWSDFWKIS